MSKMTSAPPDATAGSTEGANRSPIIGILGHFGDWNLGDEAIVEAFLVRMRQEWPGLEARIFSMHPSDSAMRYGCDAYAIRQWTEFETEFRPPAALAATPLADETQRVDDGTQLGDSQAPSSLVDWLARLVPKGRLRSLAGAILRTSSEAFREIGFVRRSIGRVRNMDVMYVTGSNQFLDNFGGAWGFPYTLLKWTAICRLVGCRVAFVSMGAGPLDGALSKWMIARALSMADYVSFRDEGSRALISTACGRSGPVVPDLAHSLKSPTREPRSTAGGQTERPLKITINAMPVHDPRYWHAPDPGKYRAYVTAMGITAKRLLAAGHDVSFFATQFPDANVARDAIAVGLGADPGADLNVSVPATVQELMELLGKADLVIATRFHGILLALLAGIPTVGICYYRKSRELLAEAGMSAFSFEIDDFDDERLVDAVEGLIRDSAELTECIQRKRRLYQEALEHQYKLLIRSLREQLRRV